MNPIARLEPSRALRTVDARRWKQPFIVGLRKALTPRSERHDILLIVLRSPGRQCPDTRHDLVRGRFEEFATASGRQQQEDEPASIGQFLIDERTKQPLDFLVRQEALVGLWPGIETVRVEDRKSVV